MLAKPRLASHLHRAAPTRGSLDRHVPWTRAEVAALALVVLVGAFLRLYQIGELPPGLHQDEAVYGLDSLEVALGHFAIYFGEREPLYMYLVAGMSFVVGMGPIVLRLTSALVGSFAVLTTYMAARSLFGPRAAFFAGATMATALWPVAISRIGFRAGTLPLVESAALWVMWEGWRHRGRWRSALGGVLLALTLYTYLAGRFFPMALLGFGVGLLVLNRRWVVERWRCLAITVAASAVAFLPLGYYFVRHPEAVFGRPAQVAEIGGENGATGGLADLPANALRTIGMFFTAGDSNWRHNLSGEPAVLLPIAIMMLLGVAAALYRPRVPARTLLIVLLPVMLAPSALSIDAPHYLRTLGAAPAMACAAGLGAAVLADALVRLAKRSPIRALTSARGARLMAALVGVVCLAPAATTYRDYFVTWANKPEVYEAYNYAHAAVGQYLASSDFWRAGRGPVYVSSRFYADRTSIIYFLWPYMTAAERQDWLGSSVRIKWFDDERALPIPASGPALYITGPSTDTTALRALGATGQTVSVSPLNLPAFGAYTLPDGAHSPSLQPLAAQGTSGLELVGYSLGVPDPQNRSVTVDLVWRVNGKPPTQTPSVFVHLLDDGDRTLAASDQEVGLNPTDWNQGEDIVTVHRLALPAGLPAGGYRAEVGLYDKTTQQRQTLKIGGRADSRVVIDSIPVPHFPAGRADAKPQVALDASLSPDLRLIGYDRQATEVSPGARLPIVLYWEALAKPAEYSLELGLLGADGREVAVQRVPLTGGRYPASSWAPGGLVRDGQELRVDPTTPAGDYRVFARLLSANGQPQGRIELGTLKVAGQPHTFDAPQPRQATSVDFGTLARLVGYDLEQTSVKPGDVVKLRLYWQALGETTTSYTVFAHLLDSAEQVQGQMDSMPAGGARPTTSWVSGEYVVDDYQLPVAAAATGNLKLEVGLYDPATGARLDVRDQDGKALGDRYLLETSVSVQR